METFARLEWQNREVDLALVHFWFPLNEAGVKLIQESLKPQHIGLFNLPLRLDEDAPLKIDKIKKIDTDIFLLKECMEKRVFN